MAASFLVFTLIVSTTAGFTDEAVWSACSWAAGTAHGGNAKTTGQRKIRFRKHNSNHGKGLKMTACKEKSRTAIERRPVLPNMAFLVAFEGAAFRACRARQVSHICLSNCLCAPVVFSGVYIFHRHRSWCRELAVSRSQTRNRDKTGTGAGRSADFSLDKMARSSGHGLAPRTREKEPTTIDGRVRHPLMFFAHVANRRWSVGPLFCFLFFVSAMLKVFLPGLTNLTTTRCRTNLYASLSSAFIYGTVIVTLIRFSFYNDDLAPMGIFTFGLLQLSFALGSCLGTNLFAHNLYSFITRKGEPARLAPRALIYGICLTVVALVMTLVSTIPNLGQLPRVGNRMVMLVAALGLGGLVNWVVNSQKPRAQARTRRDRRPRAQKRLSCRPAPGR